MEGSVCRLIPRTIPTFLAATGGTTKCLSGYPVSGLGSKTGTSPYEAGVLTHASLGDPA
jgi:hypothetical protein